jgi:pimeloyl-ACP methyl ester carboxylesterase
MGGAAAWNYVLEHPDRVNALVLIGASGWPPEGEQGRNRPLAFRLLDFGLARAAMRDIDLSAIIRSGLRDSFFDPAYVTDEMVERYSAFSRAPCHREAMINLVSGRGERRAATTELMAAVSRPTLVLHGLDDRVVPTSGGRRFGETIPAAELILYEDTGHLPHEERATETAAALKDFLQRRVHMAPDENVIELQE